MALINKKVTFSIEGVLLYRGNSDGTPVTPSRILGFAGTVDLTSFGTSAELVSKIDGGANDVQTVDYTAAVDQAAVTVAEMVTAINGAGFTDITAGPDSATGRLIIQYTGAGDPKHLQIFDGVDSGFAAALDFAQGQLYGGPGVKIVKSLDNTLSVTAPLNVKDAETIETEAGNGTYTDVRTPQITKGVDPVLTFNDTDYNTKQLVMGGEYDEAENSYVPPTTNQTDSPNFTIEKYVDIYDKGPNKRGDNAGVEVTTFWSCTGNEGDSTDEAKTIGQTIFNCISTGYNDENGDRIAYKKEQNISLEDYEALDIENL